ncbi:MAG: hypothetical protein QOK25_1449 [Thermoleophilaceae bacterium]|nr:hypothetical protein [Thermoleophilaceae bacterium]
MRPLHDSKPGTRAGVSAAVLLGAVAAVLALLQSALNLFHLRSVIYLAILVASAALAAAISRARLLSERKTVDELVRSWPPESLEAIDPQKLGVFPPNPERTPVGERLPEYVRREGVHGRVRDHIAAGRSVVLFGPDRAGKSRTAYEAAKSVANIGSPLVPTNADALVGLIKDHGHDLPDGAVLWLDDLERFVAKLTDPALQGLFQPDSKPQVVATMRSKPFAAMLDASDDLGEAGKRILTGASCFELATDLTPGELQSAIGTFGPNVDFSHGIGEALAATTEHGYVAPSPPPAGDPKPPPWSPRRFDWLLASLVGAVLLFLIGAVLLGVLGTWTDQKPGSLEKQADQIKHVALNHGERTIADKSVTFHAGSPSRFLVLRPKAASDEIRIYDQDPDGVLTEHPFSFQPAAPRATPYRLLDDPLIGDLDGDGTSEVVDSYVAHRDARTLRIPVIAFWNNGRRAYEVDPLLTEAPRLPSRVKGAVLSPLTFLVPFDLGQGRVRLAPAYGVTSFAAPPGARRILTASEIGTVGLKGAILAISVYRVDPSGGAPQLTQLCSPKHRSGVVIDRVPISAASDYRAELGRVAGPLEAELVKDRANGKCVAPSG